MKKSALFLIFIGLLTTLCLTIAAFFSFKELFKLIDYQKENLDLNDELMGLLSNIQNAETGQRGYIITGRIDYLEPYHQALQTIHMQLQRIENKSLLLKQKVLNQELISLIQLKLNEMNDIVQIRQTQSFDAAQKRMLSNEGKLLMDRIRILMHQLINYQSQGINQNQQAIQTLSKQTEGLILLTGIVPTLFFCLFGYLFSRKRNPWNLAKSQFQTSHEIDKGFPGDLKPLDITQEDRGMVADRSKGIEKNLEYQSEGFSKESGIKAPFLTEMSKISNEKEFFAWKVLIVDNDPDFRAVLTAYLHELGCQVMTASTGEEAIELAKKSGGSSAIQLITLDMLMAPLNGYDVVQNLKNYSNLKNIPIAFISIIAKEIKDKIPGVMAYIEKPITKENVLQLLQKCQAIREMDSIQK